MPGIEIKGQSKRANYRFGKVVKTVTSPITHAKNIISGKKFKKNKKEKK